MRIWIDARPPYAFEKIYSITLLERLLRQLFELGIRQDVTVIIQPNTPLDRFLRQDFRSRYPIEFTTVATDIALARMGDTKSGVTQPFIFLEGDGIYDERILKTLLASTQSLYIHAGNHEEEPIALVVQPDDVSYLDVNTASIRKFLQPDGQHDWMQRLSVHDMDSYIRELRQTAVPFLVKLRDNACRRAIENEMYENTFKGAMDFIATYIYRIPVRELVRWLAPTRITPNHITALSVICSFVAIPFFAIGWMWTGLVIACIFIIADSLDGKLARLTIRLSPVAGHVDHITSPLFEACYYLGWGWHFSAGDFTALPGQASLLLFACFGLDRITTSIFGLKYRHSLLDYTAWDKRFHLIAARRNTNLFTMAVGCAVQQPVAALYVITLWMLITMLWHMFRFALHAYRNAT